MGVLNKANLKKENEELRKLLQEALDKNDKIIDLNNRILAEMDRSGRLMEKVQSLVDMQSKLNNLVEKRLERQNAVYINHDIIEDIILRNAEKGDTSNEQN